jgi:signal transduction histidine kinase
MDIALGRAEDFTRKLMGFAQRVKLEPAPVNMREVISDVVRIMRSIGHDIRVTAQVDQRLTVLGDRPQLQQVLQNLVNNAVDAMPGGGRLTITGEALTQGTDHELPGPVAVISVTDTGSGMDAETTERAFEPFFTADPAGKGPGLGMAFSHGIIKGHGGMIQIFSQEGRGTTVRVLLPLMQVSHEQATADTRRAVPRVELKREPGGDDPER